MKELMELKKLHADMAVAIKSAEYVLAHAASPPCEMLYNHEGMAEAFVQFIWENGDYVSLGAEDVVSFYCNSTRIVDDCYVGDSKLLSFLVHR